MNEFVYQMPVKVYFGENGVEKYLASALGKDVQTVLLTYGKQSIKNNGIYDAIVSALEKAGKRIVELEGIPANPTYEKVLEGIDLYKKENVDLILAVGGGSVVDASKIIAAGAKSDADIWDLELHQGIIPEEMGRFGVVLTLSGAGAEMDNLGAVSKPETHEKRTLVGPYADFVIIDPSYQMQLPLERFLPGVYDSLTHCMETYFGNGENVSDLMNEGLMKDIVANMKELIAGSDTPEIRSNLMWDASLIQTFLFNVGKPGDFQGHQIENTLGAWSHKTHGLQLAVLLPRYYRSIYTSAPARFARFAKEVMGVSDQTDDIKTAAMGLDALESLISQAGLPSTFSEMGYTLTPEVAAAVSRTAPLSQGSLRPFTREEIYTLLMEAR